MLTNAAGMALIAVSLYALPRHELPLLALLAVPLAKGLDGAASLLRRALSRVPAAVSIPVSVLPAAVVLVAFACQGYALNAASAVVIGSADFQAVLDQQDDLVERLRMTAPPGATLMVNDPWIAVDAGLDWRVVPTASSVQIIHYAAARQIHYGLFQPAQIARMGDSRPLQPYYVCPVDVGGMRYFFFDFSSPYGG